MVEEATVRVDGATLRYGARVIWEQLAFELAPHEFLAVLGPNGAGKTTLLKALLGTLTITSGTIEIFGAAPKRGDQRIGYVPQQKDFDRDLPVRARDLVRLGVDGHRRGLPLASVAVRAAVDAALAAVGADGYANAAVGMLSGGEQQRLRIAQALVGDPQLLLCDEPLLSLDLAHQQAVSQLMHERCRERRTSVVFVTHDINPILDYVDRVLYLVEGRWAIGTPREIMTSEQLSALYGTQVDVLDVRGRLIVLGSNDGEIEHGHAHHHHGTASGRPRASGRRR